MLLEPQPEGGWTITCPIWPGLVTEADTYDEIAINVTDAASAAVGGVRGIEPTVPGRALAVATDRSVYD